MDNDRVAPQSSMPVDADKIRFSLLFTIKDGAGALESTLGVFKTHNISLLHIESRPSKNFAREYDFMTEFAVQNPSIVEQVKMDLASIAKNVTVISSHPELSKTTSTLFFS